MKRPRHFLKTEDGNGTGLSWCRRFVDIRTGRWTRIFSQTDCAGCIGEVHQHQRSRGRCAMRDPIE